MIKKYLKMFLFLVIVTLNINVLAANEIYSIDMDIYLDENANAQITETWKVKGSDGTEWYKPLRDLGNSKLSDFTVSMDGNPLTRKNWNIHESLKEKAGYYGINYTEQDTELCFGKSDYENHTFILKYNLSNYVFNVEDAQVLYWTLFPNFQQVNFQYFKVNIRSFYEFPDSLDVWAYGHKGYAYADKGIITITNEDYPGMNNQYVVALVKFPVNTFKTNNKSSDFHYFSDVKKMADQDTYEHDYSVDNDGNYWEDNNTQNNNKISNALSRFSHFIIMGIFALIGVGATVAASHSGYGYKGDKTINKKDTMPFRDIPCNKDIYLANALIALNNFNYKETNIFGAIILKWIKENKIGFIKKETGLFKKETSCIDLTSKPTFTNSNEQKLFNNMYEASKDGILEPNELEKWARRNYSEFFNLFQNLKNDTINELKAANHIYPRTDKTECKKKNVMDDYIYEESTRLLGLKIFLEEFSNMKERETMEVHIWDEYLMFAYLFGIAEKVANQLKKLYPEVIQELNNQNIDFNTILIINNISTGAVRAASNARSAAQSYSSGGGGFSIGGGGGGSFGGGGFSGGGSR